MPALGTIGSAFPLWLSSCMQQPCKDSLRGKDSIPACHVPLQVWSALAKHLFEHYEGFARNTRTAYPSLQLPFTPGHLQELLLTVA